MLGWVLAGLGAGWRDVTDRALWLLSGVVGFFFLRAIVEIV